MTRDGSAQDQGVDVVGTLVRVHSLQILGVTQHVVLIHNTVASKHVSGLTSDSQRLAAVVSFNDGNHLWSQLVVVLQL